MQVKDKTPNGVELYYQDEPKRLYRVNGKQVPSVTEVLSVLDKPALTWWGMQIGVKGVQELIRIKNDSLFVPSDYSMEELVDMLTEHKLTVNHVRDKAGVRGNSAHNALEAWAQHDLIVDPAEYPEEERGYVQGVLKFIEDLGGSKGFRTRYSELMVGSAKYEYAGRYDLEGYLNEPAALIQSGTKRLTRFEAHVGNYLIDLKTTKRVYSTHHLQLAAYEGARRECGYPPTQYRMVVLVKPEGIYNAVLTKNCYPEFIAVREAHRAMKKLNARL